jgi:hypothetical protein
MTRVSFVAVVAGLTGFSLALAGRSVSAADEPSTWGAVKGRIVWGGEPIPKPQEINVNKDQEHCLAKGPLLGEELVVNDKNRGVRWVFVWLAPEPGGPPLAIHPDLKEIKHKQVEIDQPYCQFIPHALALRQGQELVAKNSSAISHNVNWTGHPLKNPGGNVIIPAKQSHTIEGLNADRFPVKVACNIHGWMNAWVRVFDHPYFALTDADGKFEIQQAPAGNFRVIVWQEKTGWGPGGRDGTAVTIRANGTTDLGELKLDLPKE